MRAALGSALALALLASVPAAADGVFLPQRAPRGVIGPIGSRPVIVRQRILPDCEEIESRLLRCQPQEGLARLSDEEYAAATNPPQISRRPYVQFYAWPYGTGVSD